MIFALYRSKARMSVSFSALLPNPTAISALAPSPASTLLAPAVPVVDGTRISCAGESVWRAVEAARELTERTSQPRAMACVLVAARLSSTLRSCALLCWTAFWAAAERSRARSVKGLELRLELGPPPARGTPAARPEGRSPACRVLVGVGLWRRADLLESCCCCSCCSRG